MPHDRSALGADISVPEVVARVRALRGQGDHAGAEDALADAIQLGSSAPELLIEYAHCAAHRGDWGEAMRRWGAVRLGLPDNWLGYAAGVFAARMGGQLDAADELVAVGLQRFPRESELLFENARVAEARQDWEEAASRWSMVRTQLPDHWIGYLSNAFALRRTGRSAGAAAVLREGQARLPGDHRVFAEYARCAEAERDWPEAVRRWATARERFPDQKECYLGGAAALRDAGHMVESDALLSDGIERFPTDPNFPIAFARNASARHDWDEAVSRWRNVQTRFPGELAGHYGLTLALRDNGRLDEAEAVLTDVIGQYPNDAGLMLEWAVLAQRRQAMPEALRRSEIARERMPENQLAYLVSADALHALGRRDEADALLREAIARFPDHPEPALKYARMADTHPDPGAAQQRWAAARDHFPHRLECHLGFAAALRRLQEQDAFVAVLRDACERFPEAAEPLAELAWFALNESEMDQAERLFARLRDRHPDKAVGYLGGAQTDLNRGRVADAEMLMDQAAQRFPADAQVALMRIQIPAHPFARPREWDTAIARADAALVQFPRHPVVARVSVQIRRDADRLEEAWALGAALCERFPDDAELAIEQARVAFARANWQEAIDTLSALVARFPGQQDAVVRLGEALVRADRLYEAETVLSGAIARPDAGPAAFMHYGLIAARRADWPEALRRLTEASQRFPRDHDLLARIFEVRLRLAESAPEEENHEGATTETEAEALDDRALMMRFESLGGSGHGCEFGLVQRAFRAEPLSLLRWSDLGDTCEGLIDALETNLEGIGEPEHTQLDLLPSGGRNEYWTKDRRHWMAMRAFIFEDEIPPDKMFVQACRRLRFLRGKLQDDLRESQKIFVYRNMWRNLTDLELERLHSAMQALGPNWLLYIRFEDEQHAHGTVELRAPGLIIGYIDHFACSPNDEQLGSAAPGFLRICQAAYRVWREQQGTMD